MSTILVTGGAGFIGSAVAREIITATTDNVVVVDKLTYAGNLMSLAPVAGDPRFAFEQVDICDRAELDRVFHHYQPDIVMHLAAESHVDRSIDGPSAFIETNINGTFSMLTAARRYYEQLPAERKAAFRFLHISTDEVFGSLGDSGYFTEDTPYAPNSPYSASKAASDHLVRAWFHTYGLPVLTTNCSNNYGPRQFPEKLIPLITHNALAGKELPIYGDGKNVRDWLYVEDHCRALHTVMTAGTPGETYNVGGNHEMQNIRIVKSICAILDELRPKNDGTAYEEQITHVKDRPGHDRRYAIDASKIRRELGWQPLETFETGIRKTIEWYLANPQWVRDILSGEYKCERLGLEEK